MKKLLFCSIRCVVLLGLVSLSACVTNDYEDYADDRRDRYEDEREDQRERHEDRIEELRDNDERRRELMEEYYDDLRDDYR